MILDLISKFQFLVFPVTRVRVPVTRIRVFQSAGFVCTFPRVSFFPEHRVRSSSSQDSLCPVQSIHVSSLQDSFFQSPGCVIPVHMIRFSLQGFVSHSWEFVFPVHRVRVTVHRVRFFQSTGFVFTVHRIRCFNTQDSFSSHQDSFSSPHDSLFHFTGFVFPITRIRFPVTAESVPQYT